MLANRTDWKFKSNQLALRLKTLQESGVEILDLSESNPTQCQFQYLNNQLLSPFVQPENLSYEPSPKGILTARQAVQSYYREKNASVDPEHIFLTASTSEAYSFLFRLLTNPGERILVPHPSYPLFDFLADLNDVQLDFYHLKYNERGWQIDMESLIRQTYSNTKAVILVHPNNPTGSFVKSDELNEIKKLAQEKSMALISDEVFSDYSFLDDPSRAPTLVRNGEVLTFTLSGISKVLGLPQMKLGWIVATGPQEAVNPCIERLEFILDIYLSVNVPVQHALASWFISKNSIQTEITDRIQKNITFLLEQLGTSHPASCLKTEGGWYATVRIPKILSEEEWALEFLEKDHVYLHPGYFFDFEEEAYMVLSLLPHLKIFKEGVSRILARIKDK